MTIFFKSTLKYAPILSFAYIWYNNRFKFIFNWFHIKITFANSKFLWFTVKMFLQFFRIAINISPKSKHISTYYFKQIH